MLLRIVHPNVHDSLTGVAFHRFGNHFRFRLIALFCKVLSAVKKMLLFFAIVFFTVSMQAPTTVLTEAMLNNSKSVFIVNKDYTLEGRTIVMPIGKKLVFSSGSLNNGTLIGRKTEIQVNQTTPAFGKDIIIDGDWDVAEVKDSWFDFDTSPEFVSNQIIKNLLAFSNDSTFCHIIFDENRVYYFELPYKGRPDLGNTVSYRIVDGKKKRNYAELYNEEYSFLRIFTIPSNTHLTVNNTMKMLPTSVGAYFVFWEYGKENVTIDGSGIISGDNDWHRYDHPFMGKTYYGEWGHIFKCIRCSDFTFKGITLSNAFGDCIIYSGSSYPKESSPRWASNLILDHVKIIRARRNGVAVGARGVRIVDCYFEGCGTDSVRGTSPKSAIDFEPDYITDYPSIGNRDVVMENCFFIENYYDVASSVNNLPSYGKTATIIRNCQFTSGIKIRATYWMRFERCYIPYLYKNSDSKQYYSKHIEFKSCDFGEDRFTVLRLFNKKNNTFTNCRFGVTREKQKVE